MAKNYIIGRFESVDVAGFSNVPAKIDTGAFRSSIHATNIREIEKNDTKVLSFKLLGHPSFSEKITLVIKKYESTEIRSSNGHVSKRFVVVLPLRLGDKVYKTSFSLSNRKNNVFPVLIGRKALENRFLVDVSKVKVDRKQLMIAKAKFPSSDELREELL